jgi:hypothetical protein
LTHANKLFGDNFSLSFLEVNYQTFTGTTSSSYLPEIPR